MVSLDYKLCDAEKNDLINCCTLTGSCRYKLDEISNLPYGYLMYFKAKDGTGYSFVVNICDNGDGKEVNVLPECNLAGEIKKSLETLLNLRGKGFKDTPK